MHKKIAVRAPTACKLILIGLIQLLAACASGVDDTTKPVDEINGSTTSLASLEVFAGNLTGGRGSVDGTGPTASFNLPNGITADGAGNVYVADTGNHTIRKITTAGVVTLFAGSTGISGSANGTGAAARFNAPFGLATDSMANVYVADGSNHTIRKITSAGVVTTLAGTPRTAGSADGPGVTASFNSPHGVATDSAGNVYVADTENHTIRLITPARNVSTLAGTVGVPGSIDNVGSAARFNFPNSVATDSAGNVYVADKGNFTVRKITPNGSVTTLAGTAAIRGNSDNTGPAASFTEAFGVATDKAGNVYVADTYNQTIRKITPTGTVSTLAGRVGTPGSVDGTGTAARFFNPYGVATDPAGNVYVPDHDNHTIRKITSTGTVTTLAGIAATTGVEDGIGTAARFNNPVGIATDSVGNIYVGDVHSHTIRKISTTGAVTTLAGVAGRVGSADGMGPLASFNLPYGVATDSSGNVFVADYGNHTIRKITSEGTVTTFAGTAGQPGSVDATGKDARFNFPYSVAADHLGNIYVADRANHTIRKITSGGTVTTLAGTLGKAGYADGIGISATFTFPDGIATDSMGNVYVAERYNNIIRKITSSGVVTTFAGTAGVQGSADGVGAAASFFGPISIATDSTDNLYVAESANHTVRKITPAGVVSTVAGIANQATFTPGALPGRLAFPLGIAVSGDSIFIALSNGLAVVRNRP